MTSYTPQITSLLPSSIVHTRCILVEGQVPGVSHGDVCMTPATSGTTIRYAIRNGIFKSLIPLVPGENEIRLSYTDPQTGEIHSSLFYCQYQPLQQNPPLKLVIIVGADSPERYDDVPNPRHPPNLSTAIKKLRMAGYLWAAYTAAEMAHGGFGHRSFRLDEAWGPDTLSCQTNEPQQTAYVRVIRSKYTTEEIRNPERAQQNARAGSASGLFDIALQALQTNSETNGPKEHVAALFLDAHYDGKLITGHAALGGGTAQHSLAIFGSHSLFSWPTYLEDVEQCFSDETPVNTDYCGIDGEGRSYFTACNVGVGAMMHEVGHLFGCPHQENGVMLRDYVRLHRSITAIEPRSAMSIVGMGMCSWHRLDKLRFAGHPSFALPGDPVPLSGSVSCLPGLDGLRVQSASGIRVVEIYVEGHEFPKSWIETNPDPIYSGAMTLSETSIRQKLQHIGSSGTIKLQIIASNNQTMVLDNLQKLLNPERISELGNISAFSSPLLGAQDGSHNKFFLPPAISEITVHSGACLDGIEFHSLQPQQQALPAKQSFFHTKTRVNSSQVLLLGKRGGSPHSYKLAPNEFVIGFSVRSGAWIDGLAIITNLRISPFFGNEQGGSAHELRAPPGYRVCGIQGVVGDWVNRFGIMYTSM